MCQEVGNIGIEIWFHVELVGLAGDAFTNANKHVDAFGFQQLGNFSIKIHLVATTLKYVGKNDRVAFVLALLLHHIQGYGKWVDIGVIVVIDDGAVIHARFDLKAHGDGGQR